MDRRSRTLILVGLASVLIVALLLWSPWITTSYGLLPYDSPEFHLMDTVYVSPFGTVYGLPRP